MTCEIKFTVSDSGGNVPRTYTLKAENQSFINSIVTVGKNNTITMADMKKLDDAKRVAGDFNILESCDLAGRNALKEKINNDDATYQESGVWSAIASLDMSALKNDYIYVNVPVGTTMAKIKTMFHLPDGAMQNYLDDAYTHTPGDKNTYKNISGTVWFKASDFASNNGMSIDDVKAMFSK